MVKRKPKCQPLDQAGGVIYKIPCSSCETYYIGETIQKTKLRMQQHNSACNSAIISRKININDNNDCGTAKHTLETKHKWNFNKCIILGKSKFEKDRKIREGIEIYLHKKRGINLANTSEGTTCNMCWHEILKIHDNKHKLKT